MEQEWAANPSPEVTVGVYATKDQTVTHKTKGEGYPDPMCIHTMEYQNPKWGQTLKAISGWTCRKCPYGSAAFPHYLPPAQRSMTRMLMSLRRCSFIRPHVSSRTSLTIFSSRSLLSSLRNSPSLFRSLSSVPRYHGISARAPSAGATVLLLENTPHQFHSGHRCCL